jgi:hypothetical protein
MLYKIVLNFYKHFMLNSLIMYMVYNLSKAVDFIQNDIK